MQQNYSTESYASAYLPEKSIYQSDARIFHRGGFDYETIATVEECSSIDGQLRATVTCSSGLAATLHIELYAPGVLRVRLHQQGTRLDQTSPMLLERPDGGGMLRITDTPDECVAALDGYTLYLHKKPFAVRVTDAAGRTVFELENEKIAGAFVTPPLGFRRGPGGSREPYLSFRMHNGESLFGLGEKFCKVERTSTRATIWASDTCGSNTTDMAYKSVPVLYSTAGWGLMLHTSFRSFWEIGTFSYTSGSCLSEDDKLDAFLFFAPTLKGLIGQYTALTGRSAMPPKWAFGVWMSRCAYENRQQVEETLNRLRAEQIPADVVHLDPLWMKTHYYYKIGVDACDFVWREEAWPDHAAMLAAWKQMGFSTCFWLNPYLPEGSPIYDEAKARGYILKSTKGGFARLEHGQPVGMVDFTNPAAKEWWKDHLKKLVADGAAVFKPDYGDRVPEDALFHNGRTGRELHNLYLHLYAEAAFEAIQETTGDNIVWRRAGYIGSQRYPGTWAGDTQVSWEGMQCCLRGGLSAGFAGEAFWSHDIGGFVGPKPSDELYIRWAQFGLLSPFARFHGTTPREPWFYGSGAIDIVRHYAQLRYTLIPYLVQCAREAAATGVPIMRHMKLQFPDEPGVEHIDDQYMLGPSMLIAPVMSHGARSRTVYFPAGRWQSIDDPAVVLEGPRYHTVAAPLERMPVFTRAGDSIPRYATAPMHLKGAEPRVVG